MVIPALPDFEGCRLIGEKPIFFGATFSRWIKPSYQVQPLDAASLSIGYRPYCRAVRFAANWRTGPPPDPMRILPSNRRSCPSLEEVSCGVAFVSLRASDQFLEGPAAFLRV